MKLIHFDEHSCKWTGFVFELTTTKVMATSTRKKKKKLLFQIRFLEKKLIYDQLKIMEATLPLPTYCSNRRSLEVHAKWTSSPPGYLKLNFDSYFFGNPRHFGVGGVFRNHQCIVVKADSKFPRQPEKD